MAIRQLLQRWIEVLAGVYFAYLEARGARRAVIIACEGDHFTVLGLPLLPLLDWLRQAGCLAK